MASMDTSSDDGGHKKGPGVKKQKKQSTLVDMTPLVDLGFLLITFFIFTTTMSEPTAMKLTVPKDTTDKDKQTEVKTDGVLNIVIGSDKKLYSYEGKDQEGMKATNYTEIRSIILNKKKRTDPESFVVLIKPTNESDYEDTVDILDEMTINAVSTYALVDASKEEEQIMKNK